MVSLTYIFLYWTSKMALFIFSRKAVAFVVMNLQGKSSFGVLASVSISFYKSVLKNIFGDALV